MKEGDYVIIRNGDSLGRLVNPKGRIKVKITEIVSDGFIGETEYNKIKFFYNVDEIIEYLHWRIA